MYGNLLGRLNSRSYWNDRADRHKERLEEYEVSKEKLSIRYRDIIVEGVTFSCHRGNDQLYYFGEINEVEVKVIQVEGYWVGVIEQQEIVTSRRIALSNTMMFLVHYIRAGDKENEKTSEPV